MEEINMGSIISIKNLSIQLKQRTLMQDISFDVSNGEVILLSGENGIGKTSILKSIMRLETDGKKINGEIIHHTFGNIMALDDTELQRYRSSIAYISQKDEYSEMGRIQVRDVISNSGEAHSDSYMKYSFRTRVSGDIESIRNFINVLHDAYRDNRVYIVTWVALSSNTDAEVDRARAVINGEGRRQDGSAQANQGQQNTDDENRSLEERSDYGVPLIGLNKQVAADVEFDYYIFIGDQLEN